MSDDPISPTQRRLGPTDVARLAAASFGADRRVLDCGPMSGGGFAAVWWVDLDDGRRAVLKVAPPPEAGLLRYERRLIAAEARYFRLVAARVPGVPVPPRPGAVPSPPSSTTCSPTPSTGGSSCPPPPPRSVS